MEHTGNTGEHTHDQGIRENQLVPLAIVIAGIFIAAAIYFGGGAKTGNNIAAVANPNTLNEAAKGEIAPVSSSDHILGNANAKIVVVEYSDFECPFCKGFHNTMHQIVDTYKGDVAWVYREFPIVQLHSRAPKESEAAECVTELGGNSAFWKFADAIFNKTTSNNTLDPAQLPILASAAGVDVNQFNDCLSSGRYTQKITDDVAAAGKAGALGTPYSVIVTKSGKKIAINGAQPFAQVKAQIDSLLK